MKLYKLQLINSKITSINFIENLLMGVFHLTADDGEETEKVLPGLGFFWSNVEGLLIAGC